MMVMGCCDDGVINGGRMDDREVWGGNDGVQYNGLASASTLQVFTVYTTYII